ncbi:hypothetical protein ASG77_00030 [Arthrobacter sp. Soil762]|nr:hypothetical protein ASG77_00030 [Arthrobacter sp. Soil762]
MDIQLNQDAAGGDGGSGRDDLALVDRYWHAANYLTVAQIYLQDNVLLREPLRPQHIKPRLLGHWGTSPGLSLVYVHLNRLIRKNRANIAFIAGPGHGGPAIVGQRLSRRDILGDLPGSRSGHSRGFAAWSVSSPPRAELVAMLGRRSPAHP